MTTDQKIEKIRWYISVAKGHTDRLIKSYFTGVAQGVNNAWFLDHSINLASFEELNKEIDAI